VTDGPDLAARLDAVDQRIADAARAAGRSPERITRIVVTKFHPVSLIRDLLDLGVRDFGENRHQEAREKATELAGTAAVWHFVGQLQTKKARQAREYADYIHSVDRDALVDALAGDAPTRVFLQINLTDDPARGGAQPDDVPALADRIAAAEGLELQGVMAVAPLDEDPSAAYSRLRDLAERVVRAVPTATAISAGMSGDFEHAIREGATHLRIGTAITGERPVRG
jgi:PLP dependent protein